jgi:hypothetical protein
MATTMRKPRSQGRFANEMLDANLEVAETEVDTVVAQLRRDSLID